MGFVIIKVLSTKAAHEVNLAVNVTIKDQALHMLIPAHYLVMCTQEQVREINSRLMADTMSDKRCLRKTLNKLKQANFPIFTHK
jgi:hypothetical protein